MVFKDIPISLLKVDHGRGRVYINGVCVGHYRQPWRTLSLPIRDGSGRIVGVLAAEQRSKPATLEQMGY
ncbi:hypothetical protein [Neomoorella humiferrea]|uniref:hypothetical protein n=1 Tax=Neomoorella humiferrea TaxID=676965 RepID=UPI0030D077D3